MKEVVGSLVSKGKKYGVIVSRFNEFISKELLRGAIDTLTRHGVKDTEIEVFWVPGAFEIPYLASRLAKSKKYDAILCLGAVVRGETPHFNYICAEVSKGVASISLETGVPTIFGVVTADTVEQAIDRAGTKSGNKGRGAAEAALEMVSLFSQV